MSTDPIPVRTKPLKSSEGAIPWVERAQGPPMQRVGLQNIPNLKDWMNQAIYQNNARWKLENFPEISQEKWGPFPRSRFLLLKILEVLK